MVCAGFTSGAVCRVEVESEVKTFDENAVNFHEIEDWKQCELLIELIELIGSNDVSLARRTFRKESARRLRRFGRTYVKLAESSAAPFLSEY